MEERGVYYSCSGMNVQHVVLVKLVWEQVKNKHLSQEEHMFVHTHTCQSQETTPRTLNTPHHTHPGH